MDIGKKIESLFPNYRSSSKTDEWVLVCNELKLGSLISGTVVLKFDFGYVINIGVLFPALMLVGNFTPENSNLEIGSIISGNIYAFDGNKNQIGITQTGRKEWMEGVW